MYLYVSTVSLFYHQKDIYNVFFYAVTLSSILVAHSFDSVSFCLSLIQLEIPHAIAECDCSGTNPGELSFQVLHMSSGWSEEPLG